MKKKIFLSGAGGLIGKNILEQLGQKYNFFAPSHKQLDLLNSELVEKYFKKYGPFDIVLHTAIVGGNRKTGDSKDYAMDSMKMFFNVASKNKHFKRFFYFGSGIEYGKEKPIRKYAENSFGKRIPQSNWGIYKYICAKYAENSPNFVNLRIFGVFGKYEDWRVRFISNAICKNIYNLPITINQNIVISYLYIDDLIIILDKFLNTNVKFKDYNITPDKSIDLITLAKKVNKAAKKEVKIIVKQKGLNNEYTGSNKRLKNEFGDIHLTKINYAISQLYNWYLARRSKIDRRDLTKDFF